MSRIGKQPIEIPAGVTVAVKGNVVNVKGPLGELNRTIESRSITVRNENGKVLVERTADTKEAAARHGLYRALIANNVKGVKDGFVKTLIVSGVGYKCAVAGQKLTMNIGFSHPVEHVAPTGVKIECVTPTEIKVSGIDRELVGHVAANIKASKPIEPYHGYGIRYSTDVWIQKEGKTASK
ncbi:MAG: 50S ribosomal protein L6 [Clostridiales bacterium]|jgi:large subunit ribosomal protein L6|nr:50S ribosomal protein L6 [Clostridiales bacterium]